MSPEDAAKALPVVGMVGTLGLFLPGYDKSWDASPDDTEFRKRLRAGEKTYLAWALLLGLLASYAHRTSTPLWLCLAFAGSAVAVHEHALRHRSR